MKKINYYKAIVTLKKENLYLNINGYITPFHVILFHKITQYKIHKNI